MNKISFFWIGFKNAYSKNIQKDYPVNQLWGIQDKLSQKFEKINYETKEKIKKHTTIY